MALFGDSPRFHEERQLCNQSNNFLKAQTPSHVGPGSSYSMDAEDVRSGWKIGNRVARRQPMDSQSHRGESRADMYMNGTLTKDGYILHKDPKKNNYPSTGQYDPMHQPSSPRARPGTVRYMGSTSPRTLDCQLVKGVLVTNSPREMQRQRTVGPGSYFTFEDSSAGGSCSQLLKKSHNRRVSGGNARVAHSAPTTPRDSSNKSRSKSTGHSRPGSRGGGGEQSSSPASFFKRYTTSAARSPPSPVLRTPHTKRVDQQNNHQSDANTNHINSANSPYIVSPKRGIPIGRVYN